MSHRPGKLLLDEIARIAQDAARAQARAEARARQAELVAARAELAQLARRVRALERQLQRAGAPAPGPAAQQKPPALRFSAKGFASLRRRLGLSAAALATLLGVSALSVYKWEGGHTRPRARQLAAIARLRALGKRQAQALLARGEQV